MTIDIKQLACACVPSPFSRVQLFGTPWTIARQAPLSITFPRQQYWNGLPFSPPEDLPDLGLKPIFLMSPALVGGFFTTSATWNSLAQHPATRITISELCLKEMGTHCSILAWKIPWTEEPGGLQSMGLQRVRHDWATKTDRSQGWAEGVPNYLMEAKLLY